MILYLKNFGCYTYRIFDLGNKGITLLVGNSGKGKSTILNAIEFAITGQKSMSKLATHGKRSCEVILEYKDITITRKRAPCVLKVEQKDEFFEEEEAQSIINEYFGIDFSTTSYIAQNTFKSFVLLSPSKKLSFIEKIITYQSNLKIGIMKEKTNKYIKKFKEKFISETATLNTLKNTLQLLNKPSNANKITSLGKENNIEELKKIYKKEKEKLVLTKSLISLLEKKIEETAALLHNVELLLQLHNTWIKNKESINNRIKETTNKIKNINFIGNKKLKELKLQIEQQEIEEKIKKTKNQLDKLKAIEVEDYNKKIQKIQKNIWIDYSKSEVNNLLKDHKKLLKDVSEFEIYTINFNKLKTEYKRVKDIFDELKKQNISESLKIEKQKLHQIINSEKILDCPNCNSKLILKNDNLENIPIIFIPITEKTQIIKKIKLFEYSLQQFIKSEAELNTIKNQMSITENEIIKLKNNWVEELPSLNTVQDDITFLEKYLIRNINNEKLINQYKTNIKNNIFSNTIIQLEKNYLNLSKIFGQINLNSRENLPNLIQIVETQQNIQIMWSNYVAILSELKKSLCQSKNDFLYELNNINLPLKIKNKDLCDLRQFAASLREEFKDHNKLRQTYLNTIQICSEAVKNMDNYFLNAQLQQNWIKANLRLTKSEKKFNEIKKNYDAANKFFSLILEAENLAILGVVNTLNSYTQNYIDQFFIDDEMCVTLSLFKNNKKQKLPKVNITLSYKGFETNPSLLSGGEFCRLILAYTLALNELTHSPLLLLDETTSSLDDDSTKNVFDFIKTYNKNSNKLIITIDHKIVSGTFDKVVHV